MPRVHLPDGRIVHFPDGMSEADIGKAMSEIAGPPPQAAQEPSQTDQFLADSPGLPWQARAGMGIARLVKAHPAQAGAMAAGAAAAPFTGGLSWPAAMAASGAAGAGGAGLGLTAEALGTGKPMTLAGTAGTMAKEGALMAGGEGLGRLAGQGLKMLGRGAYRVALAPTQPVLAKYGDVVGEGLETGTPVSVAGLKKATSSKAARMTTKKDALAAADNKVTHSADLIAADASNPLSDYATKQVRAGLPDPTPEIADRLGQFRAANPGGSLNPSALDEVKGTLDDVAGGAYKKMRAREPLSGSEKTTVELTKSMSRANEAAVPGYRQMNREIMDAEGLRRAIERRTLGSGGNQVLDTLMMLMRGPAGVPARVAMAPQVLSTAGIGAHRAAPSMPSLLKAALLSLLSPDAPQDQN